MSSDDLGSMQRAVLKPDGVGELLRWIARRFNASAVLMGRSGNIEVAFPDRPPEIPDSAAEEINRLFTGECAAVSISGPSWSGRLLRVGSRWGGRALLVAAGEPFTPDDGALIAHAAALLELRCSADDHAKAATDIREPVLHLLMAGQVTAAHQIAGLIKPLLADRIRVYVVEGATAARLAVADICQVACDGSAWVVECPVYRRHTIILYPSVAGRYPAGTLNERLDAAGLEAAIGESGEVSLRDTAVGYEQAYHALAVARQRPDRRARFTDAADLADVLGYGAGHWARRVLAPLLSYEPSRLQDPTSAELRATLRSWLDFRGLAWRQLKIHRNTLSARIHRVEAILGRDLSRLSTQAELHLALRLLSRASGELAGPVPELGELLAEPAVLKWAEMTLAPVTECGDPPLLDTIRCWLATDARLEAAAAELGISARAVHQRLVRAEQRLGRSLLGAPSARHDVLMALRAQLVPQPQLIQA